MSVMPQSVAAPSVPQVSVPSVSQVSAPPPVPSVPSVSAPPPVQVVHSGSVQSAELYGTFEATLAAQKLIR